MASLPALAAFATACGSDATSTQPAQALTSTSLSLSSSTITAGSSVTLTATVTSSGSLVFAGSVTFYNGTTSLATQALNSSGQASWSSTSFAAGTYSLSASYVGTSEYLSSASAAASLTVSKPLVRTSVTLEVTPASETQGLPLELVAKVSAGSGAGITVPTGSVSFSAASTTLSTAPLDSTQEARFTSTLFVVGSNSVTADYSGDTNFSSSTSSAVMRATSLDMWRTSNIHVSTIK